jgi:hypothetical protein
MASQASLKHPTTAVPWSTKHYFLLRMGGYAVHNPENQNSRLRPKELLQLLDKGQVPLPDIDESDIDDKSKANWVTKSIALFQITSFVVQLLGRAIQRLPTTTLELFTLAIVVCALITYGLWWEKPFDVQKPFILHMASQSTGLPSLEYKKRIGFGRNFAADDDDESTYLESFFVHAIFLLFGTVHVIGWNFDFPTRVERVLWRIASVCCGALPLFQVWVPKLSNKRAATCITGQLNALYIVVRIFLFVEMLVGLRSVPAGVYQTVDWSQYFPALS